MEDIISFLKEQDIDIDPFNDNYAGVEPDETEIDTMDGSWVFPPIYKEDSHGNTIKWQIGFNDVTKKLITVTGRLETGNMQIFPVDVLPTKTKNYHQKAFQEAKTKFDNKMREGYAYDTGHSVVEIPQPMLANKYKPPGDNKAGNISHFPVAAQAKFDGIRNLVYADSQANIIMLTRKMNKRLHFDIIRKECERLLEFLPSGTILDGELFSDKVSFEIIASIGAKELVKHPREEDLDYYIFDIFHPDTVWKKDMKGQAIMADDSVYMKASGYIAEDYDDIQDFFDYESIPPPEECRPVQDIINVPLWILEVRLRLLVNSFHCYRNKYGEYPTHLRLTKTYVIRDRREIDNVFKAFKATNKEGAMIRHLARGNSNPLLSLYRPGRSDNLIKVKDTMETEVIITGVTSGRGKDKELALFIYKEPDTGITGVVTPAMTHEQRRHYLKNPADAIGKVYTVSFQNRTKDGKLRFPKGIAFRTE